MQALHLLRELREAPTAPFDLGSVLANMIGRYGGSDGKEFGFEACQVDSTCSWIPPLP